MPAPAKSDQAIVVGIGSYPNFGADGKSQTICLGP